MSLKNIFLPTLAKWAFGFRLSLVNAIFAFCIIFFNLLIGNIFLGVWATNNDSGLMENSMMS